MAFGFSKRGDQASRLRQMVCADVPPQEQAAPGCHVVSILSGKGGVGKTLLATNLSIAMAARGHRVILFDMDMGLANADIVLGVQARGTWSEVLKGRRSLEDVVIDAPGGVSFVPGSSGIAELADLSDFERHQLMAAMQQIESRYDVVVLDCGAGISRNVLSFAATGDTLLVVTTPEPTSLTDAYATIKVLPQFISDRPGAAARIGGVGLVVNNAISRREAAEVHERISGVAARFLQVGVTDYGYILRDDYVPVAVRERTPVLLRYPRCPASGCIMAIAAKLSRDIGQPQADQGLFYRFVNMFR
jgi:flagellar biosynthesis protein FlhG